MSNNLRTPKVGDKIETQSGTMDNKITKEKEITININDCIYCDENCQFLQGNIDEDYYIRYCCALYDNQEIGQDDDTLKTLRLQKCINEFGYGFISGYQKELKNKEKI